LFVAKYLPGSGTWAWAVRGGGTSSDNGLSVAVSGGNVYVSGSIITNTANTSQIAFQLASGGAGTLAVAGASATASADVLVAKYVDNGSSATLAWTQVGGGTAIDYGSDLAVNGSSVYVTSYLTNDAANTNAVAFGATYLTGSGNNLHTDAFVARVADPGTSAPTTWAVALL
jgi:hypothetical protein